MWDGECFGQSGMGAVGLCHIFLKIEHYKIRRESNGRPSIPSTRSSVNLLARHDGLC